MQETVVGFVCYARQNFKVVRIPNLSDEHVTERTFTIFCSERGAWTESVVRHPPLPGSQNGVVALNGILYWLDQHRGSKIVAYDPLKTEKKLRLVDLPTPLMSMDCIGVCGGKLHVSRMTAFHSYHERFEEELSIWKLVDHNAGTWELTYDTCLKDKIRNRHPVLLMFSGNFHVVAFHPYDESIIYMKY